jgi:hypothetical protein
LPDSALLGELNTMKKFSAYVRAGITIILFFLLVMVIATPVASQTTVTKVAVTSVESNDNFPNIRVQVKALDADGAFIPGLAASQFSLREDGTTLPIAEVRTAALPLNVRVVFVVDELALGSRLTDVREAIQSFAQDQMQAGDLVEVLAASEGGTQTIISLTSNADEVINGMADYNPGSANGTLLLDTVKQGLSDLAALSENTEGLNRMVVFSIGINDQLDLNETIQKAVDLGIPIHTVLLGSEDARGALGRLARETQGGNGTISPDDVNDLFETLADQSVQDQYLITYRSKVDQAGEHELVVTIGGASSNDVTFTLDELEPPSVRITAPSPDTIITRNESLFNQNSETVEPIEQTVAVEVSFPDGHPRDIVLENTALVVDGKSLGPATAIRDNGEDPVSLEFTWDLSGENTPGESSISVVVEAEDELGLKGTSDTLPITVNYVPFAGAGACPEFISDNLPALCDNFNLVIPIGSLVIALSAVVAMFVYMRRNPKVQERVKERFATMIPNMRGTRTGGASPGATSIVQPAESGKATLEVLDGKSGTDKMAFPINGTITIGRSSEHAELVFQGNRENSSISRLHCTILEKGDFFELRDEGSANGTFLNGNRLRSGDLHRLSDGDTIELARVQDGGLKLKFKAVSRSSHMRTQLVPPSSSSSDEPLKDGYTPTLLKEPEVKGEEQPREGYTPMQMKEPEKKDDDDLPKDGYTPTRLK